MATKRKRGSPESGDSSSSLRSDLQSKKRAVTVATVEKWIVDHDKTFNTATWMKINRFQVSHLKYSVCERFVDKLRGCRNFSPAFIEGSTNLRTSSFKDHARSDMHERAMRLLKKEQSSNVFEYAPIARHFAAWMKKQRKG